MLVRGARVNLLGRVLIVAQPQTQVLSLKLRSNESEEFESGPETGALLAYELDLEYALPAGVYLKDEKFYVISAVCTLYIMIYR